RLQDVLLRLDQQQVDTRLGERPCLASVHLGQLVERDVAERRVVRGRQHAGRPHRAGHEDRVVRRLESRGGALGDLDRGAVDLVVPVLEAVLRQLDRARLEGVGLEHIHADGAVAAVDLLDDVRPRHGQEIVATFLPAEVGRGELVPLQRGAHRAVEDQDAPRQLLEESARHAPTVYCRDEPWLSFTSSFSVCSRARRRRAAGLCSCRKGEGTTGTEGSRTSSTDTSSTRSARASRSASPRSTWRCWSATASDTASSTGRAGTPEPPATYTSRLCPSSR